MRNVQRHFSKAAILALVLFLLLSFSILPIIYAAFFTHPVADDYGFSFRVHNALSEGTSVFKAVFDTVVNSYMRWQGTYSAIAIFSLQPGVFSPILYCLTTFIMLGSLVGSTFFLADTVIRKIMHGNFKHVVIFSSLTLILCIQFVPDIHQTYYWFNGSAYYTLFYSLSLIYSALLIRLVIKKGNSIFLYAVILFLGIVIGGGNYTTALIVAEISGIFTAMAFFLKMPRKWMLAIAFLVFCLAFLLNITAPGNSVRAQYVVGMNPIIAVAQSINCALKYIGEWTKLPQIVYVICVSILSVFVVPMCSAKFRKPIIAIGMAFLLFASQLVPPMFAMSNTGSGRQIDIYYYSYYLLLAFSTMYLCGWAYRTLKKQEDNEEKARCVGVSALLQKHLIVISIVLFLIFCIGCYDYSIKDMTSAKVSISIMDNSLAQYDMEYKSIIKKIESNGPNVETEDIKTIPSFLSNLGLEADPENWVNRDMARYFGLESIRTP